MIDPHSGVPSYHQVADRIRAQIDAGELAPGDYLLTEPAMEHVFGVGRATVRRAIDILRHEGLVVTTRRGTQVRERQTRLAEVVIGPGVRATTRMPSDLEKRAMSLGPGVPVFVLERPGQEPEVLPGDRIALVGHDEQGEGGSTSS
jgi:DNA-binding GntR family transcriptional regulator